jgi:hypothetical protein
LTVVTVTDLTISPSPAASSLSRCGYEVLGAIGLIVPGLLRIVPVLTPVAAVGLVIIMIGATVVTVIGGPAATAVVPFIVGVLAATIAYGRLRVVPFRTVC